MCAFYTVDIEQILVIVNGAILYIFGIFENESSFESASKFCL